ncbi:unnamed protein product [Arabidopsis lyrata]|uniref:Predicted protein n=1 Tax=Arabidopsis lyrata subsp. lyrata TaxID=81972 RepID=D7KMS0_ARALL|nr:predicted protein [Arabidopsis lyrata subsp. lyrata]CAH8254562.1 unnamed protein product [Arabidopsis lyrata]
MSTINCKRCGEREDELCIFFNCASARRMWNEAPISPQISTGLYKFSIASCPRLCWFRDCLPVGWYIPQMHPASYGTYGRPETASFLMIVTSRSRTSSAKLPVKRETGNQPKLTRQKNKLNQEGLW